MCTNYIFVMLLLLNYNYRNIEFPYCVLVDFSDINSQDLIIVRTFYWQGLYTLDLQDLSFNVNSKHL